MDKNSFNSGDWFNRLFWDFSDNGFGAGLPPAADNGSRYPYLEPLLANPAIKPTPAEIEWTAERFRELLQIRAQLAALPDRRRGRDPAPAGLRERRAERRSRA